VPQPALIATGAEARGSSEGQRLYGRVIALPFSVPAIGPILVADGQETTQG